MRLGAKIQLWMQTPLKIETTTTTTTATPSNTASEENNYRFSSILLIPWNSCSDDAYTMAWWPFNRFVSTQYHAADRTTFTNYSKPNSHLTLQIQIEVSMIHIKYLYFSIFVYFSGELYHVPILETLLPFIAKVQATIQGGPERTQHLRSIISRKRGTEWNIVFT